jgi:hypothetical protein
LSGDECIELIREELDLGVASTSGFVVKGVGGDISWVRNVVSVSVDRWIILDVVVVVEKLRGVSHDED